MKVMFFLSFLLIFSSFILYPLLLIIYQVFNKSKTTEPKKEVLVESNLPCVSLIITAFNEEKSIRKKLDNSVSLDYPKDKLEIIVVSDYSNDRTDDIVREFLDKTQSIRLIRTEKRVGKVSAQNKAVEASKFDLLAFSDANNFWKKDALINLVKCSQIDGVSCVCGKLVYVNEDETKTSSSESLYWKIENRLKEIESCFYSLTALNGGIYMVKKSDYLLANSVYSHDLYFPLFFGKYRKKTVFCKDAVAFERSGTNLSDEKKRKTRMFSEVYKFFIENPRFFLSPLNYNIKFFISVFLHRTVRYLLPFLHIMMFITNIFLLKSGLFFEIVFLIQIVFVILALIGLISGNKNKILHFLFYYLFFLATMLLGFWKFLRKEVKPYWDTADSAR